ncbi:MAG: hypothetical protein KBA18_09495 [Kiritimatiellae bacterium]|nr:hypothetical protein [Kiritimatiellia bacterium]
MLTAEQILGAADTKVALENVPEWGADGQIGIRTLTGTERNDLMEQAARDERANKTDAAARKRLLGLCLCDADGKRLFTDDQVGALMQKNGTVLDRLFRAAVKHNCLDAASREALAGN